MKLFHENNFFYAHFSSLISFYSKCRWKKFSSSALPLGYPYLLVLFTASLRQTLKRRSSKRGKLQLFDAQSNLTPNELNSTFQLDQLALPHDSQFLSFTFAIGMGVVSLMSTCLTVCVLRPKKELWLCQMYMRSLRILLSALIVNALKALLFYCLRFALSSCYFDGVQLQT